MMKRALLFPLLGLALMASAQYQEDSAFIAKIFETALTSGRSYPDLQDLCKQAGPRLSGSEASYKAVNLTEAKMIHYGFDTVYKQGVMVPRWERGEESPLTIQSGNRTVRPLPICALGGSVGGMIEGEVIEVMGWNELKDIPDEQVKDKIVFFNRPMDARMVYTFGAYGTCVDQRVMGAIWAASKGAKGVIVRSMSLRIDDYPHTGSMAYSDTVTKIPAVAISTLGAEELSALLTQNPKLKANFSITSRRLTDTLSYNVVGQLNGAQYPNQFIAIGGHLDAWDMAEGAHDDGAGCIQSIEVLRLLKVLGYQPRYSLRSVMWMNEENGLKGAVEYARYCDSVGEKHVAGIEADRGAFAPRGFFVQGSPEQVKWIQQWLPLFEEYGIHVIKGG
ncbi:MAG: M28 family peptidase, partial [Bacteroidota bacterium]|nr:M28 family peptidase [Bacteroidota bacterium]MDX5430982.1 M28 family peptidase [Bacteroidota bacterium]MDX5469733.1 M28 family peptidase [Bacteroidota bacterium]